MKTVGTGADTQIHEKQAQQALERITELFFG